MNNLGNRCLLLVLLLTVGGLKVASGQITPSDDAYTDTASPTVNFGANPTVGVASASQTTYIRFDLSSIPAGYTSASIAKASLKLYVIAVTSAGSLNAVFVNGAWSEHTITSNPSPALGTTIASGVPLVRTNAKDYILIDITSAVGAWLDGTEANDGIALVPNSPLSATFDSKENTANSHPPEMDIVFSGSGTITGITTSSKSGLIGGTNKGVAKLSLLTSCASCQTLAWNGTAWACKTVSGSGTVTSVGLSAPASDFTVGGSPVTTSGALNLAWNVAPTAANTANAIVKRDSTDGFSAGRVGHCRRGWSECDYYPRSLWHELQFRHRLGGVQGTDNNTASSVYTTGGWAFLQTQSASVCSECSARMAARWDRADWAPLALVCGPMVPGSAWSRPPT